MSHGLFSLRLEGDSEMLACVPQEWQARLCQRDGRTEIRMQLLVDPQLESECFHPGWSLRSQSGFREAVYAQHGRADFSLRYAGAERTITVCVRKALDGYVRPGILYGILTALHGQGVGLHGVTLSCGGEHVILSAPSGTGKTTLSRLLEQHCGGRVINGDFALLSVDSEGVWFEPTPFCGTSRICLDERVRIDRVVFLSQSGENEWRPLKGREALVHLMNNAFVPSFDRMLQVEVQACILQMLPLLRANSFAFAPTEEAAKLFLCRQSDECTDS